MVLALFRWFDRLPSWTRPAVGGALAILVLTAGRVLLDLPDFVKRSDARRDALWLLVVAPLLGAAAGFAYSLLAAPLRRVPRVGPYVAGIITAAAYFTAMLGMIVASGEQATGARWTAVVVCTLVFGPVFGHQFLRDVPARPAP